jgi:transglutaminase-like putative cysteine protease
MPARAASDFTYDTKVTYRVEADSSTTVTEAYTITNNTARKYLTEIQLFTPTKSVTNLQVSYADGGAIAATAKQSTSTRGDIKYDIQQISISFPRVIVGAGRTWKFNLTYRTTGLVDSKGSGHTVYVPSIEPGDPGDKYTATIDVPAEFGTPHFAGAKSATGGTAGLRQIYTFNKADLVEHSLALAFGDNTVYKANLNFPLRNDAPWPQTLTVTLPPDLNNQKVYLDNLEPKPNATRLDEDGNVLADYTLAAHQQIVVTTDLSGQVNYLEYDLSASKKKSDIPEDLAKKYTKATRYWPTDGPVADEAKKLVSDDVPVINNVKAIYQYVIDKLSYNNEKIKFNIRQGAAKALEDPSNAVCLEYADLMIAMLRSQGIPARMPVGYSYSGNLKNSNSVVDSLHAWVEAYVPGIGWMTFDPTWGEKFDDFGKSDLDHFAFAVWGSDDSAPAAVMAGLTDTDYQYEGATIEFRDKVVANSTGGAVSAWRWVILPFLAFDHVTVTAPGQIASDDNQVELGNEVLALGSLAPNQKAKLNRLVAGSAWSEGGEAKFGRADGAAVLVLAASQIKTNYYVPIGLAIIFLIIVVVVVWRKHKRRTPSVEVTDEAVHV